MQQTDIVSGNDTPVIPTPSAEAAKRTDAAATATPAGASGDDGVFSKMPMLTADGLRVFTVKELWQYRGIGGTIDKKTGIIDTPIYLAILGHVFDVSTGAKHYAEKMGYQHMAGRDASRTFATGESKGEGVTDDVAGLDDDELEAIGSWYTFFDTHETYRRVGRPAGRPYDPATGGARRWASHSA